MTERRFLGRQEITADVRRLQAMIGTLYAAGGLVKLDADGIEIIVTNAADTKRSYKFVQAAGGTPSAYWGSHTTAAVNYGSLWVQEVAGKHGLLSVIGRAPAAKDAEARILASQNTDTNYCGIYCIVEAGTTERVTTSITGDPMFVVEAGKVYGKLAADAVAAEDVRLQADNELTWFSSVRALKRDITPWQAPTAAFMQLKPVTFRPVEDPEHAPIVGLIAEDVEAAMPHAVSYRDGKLSSWDDKQMMVTLLSVVQQQQKDIEALQARVAALEAK